MRIRDMRNIVGMLCILGIAFTALGACSNPFGSSGGSGSSSDNSGGEGAAAVTYTVTYDANGETTIGTPPFDESLYEDSAEVTVLGNTGNLEKDGHTFLRWNDAADGSGADYVPGATFPIESDMTLYARWVEDTTETYTVSYDGNEADEGEAPEGANYLDGETVTVLGNTGGLEKGGHTFLRWNSQDDGEGTGYAPGDSFTITGHLTLFAQWTEEPTYTVNYDGNGADGGSVPAGAQSYLEGEPVTVLGNIGGLVKSDHTFAGWNTAADGQSEQYRRDDEFEMPDSDVTLYAQWSPPLTEEDDIEEAFNTMVHETIAGDPDNGFEPVEGEEGVYVYEKTGGGSLRFWQVNASGTISFDVTLEEGPGNDPTGDVEVYRVDSDGAKGELIVETTVELNEETTVVFDIPDCDFQIDFQGGQRVWEVRNFSLALDE